MVNSTSNLYDLTNISASNNIYEFTKAVNDMADKTLFMGLLIATFVILFVSMKNYGNRDAFMTSSFITVIMAIILSLLGFIPVWFSVILTISFTIPFAFFLLKRE